MLHASAALVALLVNTVLSVYKPRGMTAYGRRKIESRGFQAEPSVVLSSMTSTAFERARAARAPRWGYVLGIHAIGFAVLFMIIHLSSGVPGH